MKSRTAILFIIPCLIWGSTWYAIKFQVGNIDPLVSVAYRSMLGGALLLLFLKLRKQNLRYTFREHGLMAFMGASLFGFNYWIVYEAETVLTSGLVAILFSLFIVSNIIFNTILLKGKLRKEVVFGALLGIAGTAMLFYREFGLVNTDMKTIKAIGLCFLGVIISSLGNIFSVLSHRRKLPVMQTNAFAMIYGSILMFLVVLVLNKEIKMDWTIGYIGSLGYLAVFGSIIAFTAYLNLLGEIGADRAAYVTLITPAIALVFSTFFEGYQWGISAFAGLILLMAGNMIALKIKPLPVKRTI